LREFQSLTAWKDDGKVNGEESAKSETGFEVVRGKRRKWKWFLSGLAVRILGLFLVWIGDGSDSLFRKPLVIIGVILSIGGIAVLRYLLITGFRTKKK
jgi:hypothetical protein